MQKSFVEYVIDFSSVSWMILKAPKASRGIAGKSSRSPGGVPQQSPSSQWESILKFLDSLMSRLRENHVCTHPIVSIIMSASIGAASYEVFLLPWRNFYSLSLCDCITLNYCLRHSNYFVIFPVHHIGGLGIRMLMYHSSLCFKNIYIVFFFFLT